MCSPNRDFLLGKTLEGYDTVYTLRFTGCMGVRKLRMSQVRKRGRSVPGRSTLSLRVLSSSEGISGSFQSNKRDSRFFFYLKWLKGLPSFLLVFSLSR